MLSHLAGGSLSGGCVIYMSPVCRQYFSQSNVSHFLVFVFFLALFMGCGVNVWNSGEIVLCDFYDNALISRYV